MTDRCGVDFETRSAVDLKSAGVYRYSEDETTEVLCLGWAINDDDPDIWFPGEPFPKRLREYIGDGGDLYAWNAQFERTIWREILHKRLGLYHPKDNQWWCTAAQAAALGLPRALEQCAQALQLPVEKDMAGHRLMMQMCKPRKPRKGEPTDQLLWWDDNERLQRLGEYCKQDVVVERMVAASLVPLSPTARELYLLDQRINDRGVHCDLTAIAAAKRAVTASVKTLDARLVLLTDGEVSAVTQVGRLTAWLVSRGLEIESLDKKAIEDLLAFDTLPPDVREALLVRQEGGKSSTSKLNAMERAVCRDGRLRGMFLYHGAATGRWAGKIVQMQNLPSPPDNWPGSEVIDDLLAGDLPLAEALHGPLMPAVSYSLRQMLTATPGNGLVVYDYAAIEARVLAWVAGEQWRLDVFKTHGKIYEASASKMFNVPMDTVVGALRKKGKVAELALGYAGSVGALTKMGALAMGLTEPELKPLVDAWRAANPAIVQFWHDLDGAVRRAIRQPGVVQVAGPLQNIKFVVHKGWLWLRLPSGRRLAYCAPHFTPDPDWGDKITYWGVDGYTRKWSRQFTYGGTFCENICQAVSADITSEAMLRLDAAGFNIVLHVHDEIGSDEADASPERQALFQSLMCQTPSWAEGLPIKAAGDSQFRYRKD